VHQAYTKCEEIRSAQVNAQISLQLAIAEVSRAHRQKDVHESLMALEARVEALRGEAQSDVPVQQVIEQLSAAVREQLSGVSADLSAAMMAALQQGSESAMDVITQMNRDVECVRAKLTVTQDSILAFVSQHAVMLEMLIRGRFNIPQVALLVPTK
jgi:hypothetical protein